MDAGDASDLGGCNHRMSARMASNASSEAANRSRHVNSQRCDGSALRRLPHRGLELQHVSGAANDTLQCGTWNCNCA
ncbi:hypothetical protein M514_08892, partial [Trichuris suis]